MHFNMQDWKDGDDPAAPRRPVPYRVLKPSTGEIIQAVREFNDDEGWVRVIVRHPDASGYYGQWAVSDADELITQVVHMPFQVVPFYDGIDDLPGIYVDDLQFIDGKPVGDWLPSMAPYQHTP